MSQGLRTYLSPPPGCAGDHTGGSHAERLIPGSGAARLKLDESRAFPLEDSPDLNGKAPERSGKADA